MSLASPWWQTFFHGPWGELQRAGYPPERTRAEVDFQMQALRLAPGARVLDVPCGEGRHSIELARRGCLPTGIDFSEASIAHARRSAADARAAAEFRVEDMRALDFEAEFQAALCFFGSFGYFDDADNLEFARRVARALAPGGRFLIEAHVAESLFPKFREHDWYWADAAQTVRVLEERRFDLVTRCVESTWTFLKDGQVHSDHISMRLYTHRELCELLSAAGFKTFQSYAGASLEPFRLGSPRLALVAERG